MNATTTDIKKELKLKSASSSAVSDTVTRSLDSAQPSQPTSAATLVSRSYLKDAAGHLLIWMERMRTEEASPQNVNAVCNIAQQVANLVRVNIELKKAGL